MTGRTMVRRHTRKLKRPKVIILSKKERKLFDAITKNPNSKEIALVKDFEKDKKGRIFLEKQKLDFGNADDIEFNISDDKEIILHSHPHSDILTFSEEDMQEITRFPHQQAEILLHNGNALLLIKPKKLNRKKFLDEYNSTMQELRLKGASDKEMIGKSQKVLKKHNFKLKKFKPGKPIKMNLRRVY